MAFNLQYAQNVTRTCFPSNVLAKHFSLDKIQSDHYLAAKKKTVSKKKKQNSSANSKTILPQPKLYPLSSKKPEEKKSIYHAAGVRRYWRR